MKQRRLLFNSLFLIVVSTFLPASCSEASKPEDEIKTAKEHNDEKFDNEKEKVADFVVNVAEMSLNEMQLGELSQGNAHHAKVKELGKMMVEDHRKAHDELSKLAEGKSITIPGSVSEEKRRACDRLGKKTGEEFDKEYCEMVADSHKEAIRKFEEVAEEGSDDEIRAWASKQLPRLRMHLDHTLICLRQAYQKGGRGDTAVLVRNGDNDRAGIDQTYENKKSEQGSNARKKEKTDW